MFKSKKMLKFVLFLVLSVGVIGLRGFVRDSGDGINQDWSGPLGVGVSLQAGNRPQGDGTGDEVNQELG